MAASLVLSAGRFGQLFRDGLTKSITELANDTGLSRSTIRLRINELEAIGLVGRIDETVSTGGRPATRYQLLPENWPVVGIDIGVSHCAVGLLDLAGNILASASTRIDISDGPEIVLDQAIKQIRDLLRSRGTPAGDVAAIGIGLPGPVEHATGRPIDPPIMPGWHNFDVPSYFKKHFTSPVFVDNDANVAALGVREIELKDEDVLLYVKVAAGIGAGIVSDGVLQRGSQGIAGDIGHIQVDVTSGRVCQCGTVGCLEAVASGSAVLRDVRASGLEVNNLAELAALTRTGQPIVTQRVREAGRVIGAVLTMCVNVINPSVIVVDGDLALAGDHLLSGIREVVYSRSMPLATRELRITRSRMDGTAALVGAGMLAVEQVLSTAAIDRLVADAIT